MISLLSNALFWKMKRRCPHYFPELVSIFNDFFVKQCSLLENEAVLPALFPRTSLILEDTEVSPRKILEIIRSLDSNKAYGCDDVCISMLKICDEAIVLPLKLIHTNCLP